MKKRTVLLFALTLTLSLSACGNKAEDVENAVTDTGIVEVTEELEIEITEESTEQAKGEVVEESTEEVIKESIEETTKETPEEKPGVVEENSTSETKPGVEANVGGNTGNGGNNGNNGGNETPSSETSTTPPVVNPEPTNPPASSGNGDNLSFSGSVTLPSGLTISTLDEFNGAGMDTSAGNSFMGDIYSDIVAKNYETMADNFDAFNAMYSGSVINVTNGEQIWWRASMADSSPSLELRRCGDHYKIIISSPCLDDATAESMGWMSGREAEAREALTVLLSTISSQPTTIQNAILQTVYDAPAGQEPIDTNGNWTRIGDCQIRLGAYDFENGNHVVVFRIAP